jgi:hypothetical protein
MGYVSHPTGLNVMNPTSNCRLFQEKRILFEKSDVGFDTFLKVGELQEFHLADCISNLSILRLSIFDNGPELIRSERQHTTTNVAKDSDFASAQKSLRYDDAANGFASGKYGSAK